MLQIVPQLRKKQPLFFSEGTKLLCDNLKFPVLIVSPPSWSVLLTCFVFCISQLLYNLVLPRKGLIQIFNTGCLLDGVWEWEILWKLKVPVLNKGWVDLIAGRVILQLK